MACAVRESDLRMAPAMNLKVPVALLIAFWGSISLADLRHNAEGPQFTPAEAAIIGRNPTLQNLRQRDPWLVRQAVDLIGKAETKSSESRARAGTTRLPDFGANFGNDPDLQKLERASPEAAHDLFLLIKKAVSRIK